MRRTSAAVAPAGSLKPAKAYRLPDSLRGELALPFGPVVDESGLKAELAGAPLVVCVGDVVSLTCKRLGVKPKAFLVDYHTQRKAEQDVWREELGSWGRVGLTARNPAGTITREAWDAVERAFWLPETPVRVAVDGEEDLLGIPCFLLAPDGAKVLYGMPNQGIVVVTVDEEVRRRVRALLARFEQA